METMEWPPLLLSLSLSLSLCASLLYRSLAPFLAPRCLWARARTHVIRTLHLTINRDVRDKLESSAVHCTASFVIYLFLFLLAADGGSDSGLVVESIDTHNARIERSRAGDCTDCSAKCGAELGRRPRVVKPPSRLRT